MSDLHSAVEKNDIARVSELLKGEQLSINQPNSHGVYPLHLAAKVGNVQMAEILVQNNAKVNGCVDQHGLTPLHYAARSGNKDVLIYLLKNKAPVDSQMGPAFWTPLHFATYFRHAEIVKILCEYNASVDETNGQNQTALHLACEAGCKEIIQILMAKGASLTKIDKDSKTPFERLSIKENPNTAPVNHGGYTMDGLEALAKDFKTSLLLKDIYSDISFVFDGEQPIPAHRNIILARAPDFLKKIQTEFIDETDPSGKTIKLKNTSYNCFKLLLEWIYTSTIEIDEVNLETAIELYKKSEDYNLPILKVFVEGVINFNLDITTAKAVFEVAVSNNAITIVETCSNFIAKNFGKIMKHAATASENDNDNNSNSMNVEKPPLFTKEELEQISNYLMIIESPVPPYREDSPMIVEPKPVTKPLEKKEILNGLPNTNTKRNTQQAKPQPPQQQQQQQKTNDTRNKEETKKDDGPSDAINAKSFELVKKLIQDIYDIDIAIDFREPVPKDYPGYLTIIKNPMDLGTIRKNLLYAQYIYLLMLKRGISKLLLDMKNLLIRL